jgi:hypothetical protein
MLRLLVVTGPGERGSGVLAWRSVLPDISRYAAALHDDTVY